LGPEDIQNEAFTANSGRNRLAEFMKFPVLFPVSREFSAEKGSHMTASSARLFKSLQSAQIKANPRASQANCLPGTSLLSI
jgi:hypothetical protein